MKPITVWSRYHKDTDTYIHNHIEDGHCENDIPTSKDKVQKKSWNGGDGWKKEFCYLNDNYKVVKND